MELLLGPRLVDYMHIIKIKVNNVKSSHATNLDLRSLPFPGKFKSAAVIIRDELTDEEKNRLVMHVTEAFKGIFQKIKKKIKIKTAIFLDFRPEDVAVLVGLLMTNQSLVVSRVIQFLVSEMRMQIID